MKNSKHFPNLSPKRGNDILAHGQKPLQNFAPASTGFDWRRLIVWFCQIALLCRGNWPHTGDFYQHSGGAVILNQTFCFRSVKEIPQPVEFLTKTMFPLVLLGIPLVNARRQTPVEMETITVVEGDSVYLHCHADLSQSRATVRPKQIVAQQRMVCELDYLRAKNWFACAHANLVALVCLTGFRWGRSVGVNCGPHARGPMPRPRAPWRASAGASARQGSMIVGLTVDSYGPPHLCSRSLEMV